MKHFSRYLFGIADPERQVIEVQEFACRRLSRTPKKQNKLILTIIKLII